MKFILLLILLNKKKKVLGVCNTSLVARGGEISLCTKNRVARKREFILLLILVQKYREISLCTKNRVARKREFILLLILVQILLDPQILDPKSRIWDLVEHIPVRKRKL